jgi:hypothetical protein
LTETGIVLRKSDTTGEIYEKAVSVKGIGEPFFTLTKSYEEVRYGDTRPAGDMFAKLQEEYNRVRDLLGR